MSAEILCSPEELRGHASAIRSQATDTTTSFNAMKSRLEQLQGEFRGQAATAFDARWNDWHVHATGLIQALDHLGNWLSNAAESIESTDHTLAQGLQ